MVTTKKKKKKSQFKELNVPQVKLTITYKTPKSVTSTKL